MTKTQQLRELQEQIKELERLLTEEKSKRIEDYLDYLDMIETSNILQESTDLE